MNKRLLVLISLFLFLSVLFVQFPRVAQAANLPQPFIDDIQQMINTALVPFQSAQQALITRVSNLEATVTPIPSEIAGLQATLTPIPGEITALQTHQAQTDQTLANQGAQINTLSTQVSSLTASLTPIPTPPFKGIWVSVAAISDPGGLGYYFNMSPRIVSNNYQTLYNIEV